MSKHFLWVFFALVSLFVAACGEKETVIDVQSIAISQPSAEMEIGQTLTLKATVSPSNASYDGLNWTSTNPKVASVSASGLVTALSEGNTTITVMAGGKTASCAITVVKGYVAVTSISLNKTSLELVEGDSESLVATVLPDDATDKAVTWASSNEAVATVKDRKVTAIKEGEATVSAKAGDKTASCKVIVTKKGIAIESIELSNYYLALVIGESETLTVVIKPDNATDKSVSWKSSNNSVATVTENGKVTAIKDGEATISASSGEITATCIVIVQKKDGLYAVDLGLSVAWASCNIGASRPEEFGDYFAWGDPEPYYTSRDPLNWREGKMAGYDWDNYKWWVGDDFLITKYCIRPDEGFDGFADEKTTLDLEDDAAHVLLGGKWRMPTVDEQRELVSQCVWEWIKEANGYSITGPNGNHIFLPAAGRCFQTDIHNTGIRGYYWSSSLCEKASVLAYFITVSSDQIIPGNAIHRCYGNTIRPVSDK